MAMSCSVDARGKNQYDNIIINTNHKAIIINRLTAHHRKGMKGAYALNKITYTNFYDTMAIYLAISTKNYFIIIF